MKILDKFMNLISFEEPDEHSFTMSKDPYSKGRGQDDNENMTNAKNVFPSIDVNKEYIKKRFNYPNNSDIKIREFSITIREKQYSAFLLYIDGMIDSDSINRFVIEPLMLRGNEKDLKENQDIISKAVTHNVTVRRVKKFDLENYILEHLVPQNDIGSSKKFDDIAEKVNSRSFCAFY